MMWILPSLVLVYFVLRCELVIIRRKIKIISEEAMKGLDTPEKVFTNPYGQRIIQNGTSTILLKS